MSDRPHTYDSDALADILQRIPEAQIDPQLVTDLADVLAPHKLPIETVQTLAQTILTSVDPQRTINHLIRYLDRLTPCEKLWQALQQHPQAIAYMLNIFAGSQFLSHILFRRPELLLWLLDGALWSSAYTSERLEADLMQQLQGQATESEVAACIRSFTHQSLLCIGARDLNHLVEVETITADLSALADCVIRVALNVCREWLNPIYGAPMYTDDDGHEHPCHFCVIGMGKLGGYELNFSSDIDLMYVYTSYQGNTCGVMQDGQVQNQISNHEYFVTLARRLTNLIGGKGPEGQAFRVDLRLRPEGTQGQLALSLLSYEAYYTRLGQLWEKMALLKARPVAGDPQLGAEFMTLIQPFVYQRHLDPDGVRQIQAMKQQIDVQIADKNQSRTNIKLGLGGIREIEFFIQILQLLFAGRLPALQERHSLRALTRLREAELIPPQIETTLRQTYCYLRQLEHRLQMEQGAQTHLLPRSEAQQGRLARLCGYPTWNIFYEDYLNRTEAVHMIFTNAFDKAPTLSVPNSQSEPPIE